MKAGHGLQQFSISNNMAKRKKEIKEPFIHPGVPLPLENMEIPDEWLPVDDFSSHRPMLYRTIMNTAHTAFVEFGTGFGSTPLLKELYATCLPSNHLISYENDQQWFELMLSLPYKFARPDYAYHGNHALICTDNLLSPNIWNGSIVFIDCAPGELRKHLISKHSNIAKMIIVHDTEPGAEYVYGMNEILSTFNHRCDLIVEGSPQTTVVSNLYDFTNWKTTINDQIRFI